MNILKVLTDKRIKGNTGEYGVAKLLKKRKYRVIEKNYIAGGQEIDIIAKNNEYICFVEVKTRSDNAKNTYGARPADAVNREKRRSIISAAKIYSSIHSNDGYKFRFDVAEVYLDDKGKIRQINYLENAFTADRDYNVKFKST